MFKNTCSARKLPLALSKRLYYEWFDKCSKVSLQEEYERAKEIFDATPLNYYSEIRGDSIFVNNELDLGLIKAYGFDYDVTLARYKQAFGKLLFETAKKTLVNKFGYPKKVMKLAFDPYFPIRGLHFDIKNGWLLKLDSFAQVQLSSVYRGKTKLTKEQILKVYKTGKIPFAQIEGPFHMTKTQTETGTMKHLSDFYALPESDLICSVIDLFDKSNIKFHPEILFNDVIKAIQISRKQNVKTIASSMPKYLSEDKELRRLFERLKDGGKTLFIVTNSSYRVVTAILGWLLGNEWRDLLDFIIINANKPTFFTDYSIPLREYNEIRDCPKWKNVREIRKGKIYYGGNIKYINYLTGWKSHETLYFGYNPYADLAELTLEYGWRTGAIIDELKFEIKMMNTEEYRKTYKWLSILSQLIERCQDRVSTIEDDKTLQNWFQESCKCKENLKAMSNPQFGSPFRTHQNPTLFSRRLARFCDIYTSKLTNLLNYNINTHFFPYMRQMPHEYNVILRT